MKRLALGALLALVPTAAAAVGLGPLSKEGVTDGPAKGFYLTLYNPYEQRTPFVLYAIGAEDEARAARVRLNTNPITLPAKGQRKLMIVADGLQPGERYSFRVCAERYTTQEESIHARVCSRLTARRVAGL